MSRRLLRVVLTIAAVLGLGTSLAGVAAQGMATVTRMAVVDGGTGELSIVDVDTAEVIARFSTPGGEFVPVYTTESGRYFVAHHYDGDQVTIVDTGVKRQDHGDHTDLVVGDPFVLATVTTGNAPAHWWAHDGILAVYNDGDGTLSLFDETELAHSTAPVTFLAGEPDHAAFVIIDDVLVVAGYDGGTVDAYDLDGGLVASEIADCPGAHGEWVFGNSVVFGCTDGLAVVTVTGGELTSHKVANPETETAATDDAPRVSTIVGHDDADLLIGNFGAGLALIDVDFRSGEITPLPLPARPVGFTYDESGDTVLALTDDGSVHGIDPVAGEILWTTEEVVTPYSELSADGSFGFYPDIDVAGELVYVPEPGSGEIIALEIANGEIAERIEVGGRPARLTILSARGVGH